MELYSLHPPKGALKKRKRVGRGIGSGHGKTSTRGHKGQKSRSGGNIPPGFEGGQMPLIRRLPKKGFRNTMFKVVYEVVNVGDLERFEPDTEVTVELLRKERIVRRTLPVKLLGKGEITKPLVVRVDAASRSAIAKIEKAGGKVEVR